MYPTAGRAGHACRLAGRALPRLPPGRHLCSSLATPRAFKAWWPARRWPGACMRVASGLECAGACPNFPPPGRSPCSKDGFKQSSAEAPEGGAVGLVLEATSFYAESGGQTADTGAIAAASGAQLDVEVGPPPGLHAGRGCGVVPHAFARWWLLPARGRLAWERMVPAAQLISLPLHAGAVFAALPPACEPWCWACAPSARRTQLWRPATSCTSARSPAARSRLATR